MEIFLNILSMVLLFIGVFLILTSINLIKIVAGQTLLLDKKIYRKYNKRGIFNVFKYLFLSFPLGFFDNATSDPKWAKEKISFSWWKLVMGLGLIIISAYLMKF